MSRLMFFRFCLFFLLAAAMISSALALEVRGVRPGVHSDKTRIVIELSEPAAFRAFMMADPVRLAVDLPAYAWKAGPVAGLGHTGIRQVRQGPLQVPGFSRIVIDLDKPFLIQAAFAMPKSKTGPDKIVIDIATASAAKFAQDRGKILGGLKVTGASANPPATPPTSAKTARPPRDMAPTSSTLVFPQVKRPLIVVDAGHGGDDPGAPGSQGLKEKNITLAMARDLKAHLEATGRYRVILTRDKDVFIRLSERVAFARRNKADLFISLHADSISRPGVRGASIYTLSETASDKETEKLAARENLADAIAGINLDTEDQDVANILVDLAMRDTMNQSKFFANKIVKVFRAGGINTLDTAHRFAGFAVLKAPDIPSVLIELGYMSNDREAGMLSTPAYRNRIADALVSGIDYYFNTVRP